ncbi:unnamed protein product [Bemisia tabaci]|uniref:Nucleolar GTP-binding protein 2 n=1 Tax=Bemisia tabaci TaxID=7038 RepID=A0A9P0C8Q3_BEMTA|nr:PREDICTED: nucleolar GTP-binding protein 2 isoform X2 [Bemisia tabaci]CAH0754585.1 unnamed protein product [Bemisia tabaci]
MAKTKKGSKMKADKPKGSAHSLNPDRDTTNLKRVSKPRSASTIKRLQMYKNFKPKRNKRGKILRAAPFQGKLPQGTMARVEPNRKWFGNTRVISQKALQQFQEELGKAVKNPYDIVMKPTNLPITLLNEKKKFERMHVLEVESYENVFGPKKQRKRPSLSFQNEQQFVDNINTKADEYKVEDDLNKPVDNEGVKRGQRDKIMSKGQSRRIWNELYKVIDSSDVVVMVLDARNPQGTRCAHIEKFLKDEKPHKHLFFLLNKVDLVPIWVTQRWVQILSAEYPTIAFHASLTHAFGKGSLINLLRQFAKLHSERKQISVGFVGYPNVGKSSVINTLRSKKVCKVAPIAGETKVWQYITLTRRIYLIDCPGVVYDTAENESDTEKVLKGVVRVEMVPYPEQYIPDVLEKVKKDYVIRTYGIKDWEDSEDFLKQLAVKTGKLMKGGEPDCHNIARLVLNDWQRGKVPFYTAPPGFENPLDSASNEEEENVSGEAVSKGNESELKDTEEKESNETETQEEKPLTTEEEKEAKLLKVKKMKASITQDFRKIRVISDFFDEPKYALKSLMQKSEEKDEEEQESTESHPINEDVDNDNDDSSSSEDEAEVLEKQKKKREKEEALWKSMTSKQRRALIRKLKRKRTGSDFYEVTNVKNRRRK